MMITADSVLIKTPKN